MDWFLYDNGPRHESEELFTILLYYAGDTS